MIQTLVLSYEYRTIHFLQLFRGMLSYYDNTRKHRETNLLQVKKYFSLILEIELTREMIFDLRKP